MWHILKSEIEYNKVVLIAVYAVALVFFIAGHADDRGAYNVVPNTLVPFFIGFGFLCQKSCAESRTRQHCMLPQSRTEYGITRMLFFALFQGGILLLWLITYLVKFGESPEAIWMMLSANALVLTIRAVGFLFEDTRARLLRMSSTAGWSASNIAQRVMRVTVYTVLGFVLVIAVGGTGEGFTLFQVNSDWAPEIAVRNFSRSPIGAFTMNVVFMVTFFLSVTSTLPRRSFARSR